MLVIGLAFLAFRALYHRFDHTGKRGEGPLSPDARVVDISSKQVQYAKNGAKYKTTVLFSDGFYFVTHKTNRTNNFLTYNISIDEALAQEIVKKAVSAHQEALLKQSKQGRG